MDTSCNVNQLNSFSRTMQSELQRIGNINTFNSLENPLQEEQRLNYFDNQLPQPDTQFIRTLESQIQPTFDHFPITEQLRQINITNQLNHDYNQLHNLHLASQSWNNQQFDQVWNEGNIWTDEFGHTHRILRRIDGHGNVQLVDTWINQFGQERTQPLPSLQNIRYHNPSINQYRRINHQLREHQLREHQLREHQLRENQLRENQLREHQLREQTSSIVSDAALGISEVEDFINATFRDVGIGNLLQISSERIEEGTFVSRLNAMLGEQSFETQLNTLKTIENQLDNAQTIFNMLGNCQEQIRGLEVLNQARKQLIEIIDLKKEFSISRPLDIGPPPKLERSTHERENKILDLLTKDLNKEIVETEKELIEKEKETEKEAQKEYELFEKTVNERAHKLFDSISDSFSVEDKEVIEQYLYYSEPLDANVINEICNRVETSHLIKQEMSARNMYDTVKSSLTQAERDNIEQYFNTPSPNYTYIKDMITTIVNKHEENLIVSSSLEELSSLVNNAHNVLNPKELEKAESMLFEGMYGEENISSTELKKEIENLKEKINQAEESKKKESGINKILLQRIKKSLEMNEITNEISEKLKNKLISNPASILGVERELHMYHTLANIKAKKEKEREAKEAKEREFENAIINFKEAIMNTQIDNGRMSQDSREHAYKAYTKLLNEQWSKAANDKEKDEVLDKAYKLIQAYKNTIEQHKEEQTENETTQFLKEFGYQNEGKTYYIQTENGTLFLDNINSGNHIVDVSLEHIENLRYKDLEKAKELTEILLEWSKENASGRKAEEVESLLDDLQEQLEEETEEDNYDEAIRFIKTQSIDQINKFLQIVDPDINLSEYSDADLKGMATEYLTTSNSKNFKDYIENELNEKDEYEDESEERSFNSTLEELEKEYADVFRQLPPEGHSGRELIQNYLNRIQSEIDKLKNKEIINAKEEQKEKEEKEYNLEHEVKDKINTLITRGLRDSGIYGDEPNMKYRIQELEEEVMANFKYTGISRIPDNFNELLREYIADLKIKTYEIDAYDDILYQLSQSEQGLKNKEEDKNNSNSKTSNSNSKTSNSNSKTSNSNSETSNSNSKTSNSNSETELESEIGLIYDEIYDYLNTIGMSTDIMNDLDLSYESLINLCDTLIDKINLVDLALFSNLIEREAKILSRQNIDVSKLNKLKEKIKEREKENIYISKIDNDIARDIIKQMESDLTNIPAFKEYINDSLFKIGKTLSTVTMRELVKILNNVNDTLYSTIVEAKENEDNNVDEEEFFIDYYFRGNIINIINYHINDIINYQPYPSLEALHYLFSSFNDTPSSFLNTNYLENMIDSGFDSDFVETTIKNTVKTLYDTFPEAPQVKYNTYFSMKYMFEVLSDKFSHDLEKLKKLNEIYNQLKEKADSRTYNKRAEGNFGNSVRSIKINKTI